ncbi:hypothetical protein Rsub_03068 [Raphidocelis subcapitata]|uniref:Uncharacterized protein n=1 Tax=Raphidocelis subcapitata TaxID=307507 RepID=A0A2V0P0Q0_9CHLO|nr:hypothetical protein Rsub_03068 [Raphidocelis subcapitata]|eukprot:GBF90767.1 hypothetical protein Rsub_03068 [Raphidocelis subcapitata]
MPPKRPQRVVEFVDLVSDEPEGSPLPEARSGGATTPAPRSPPSASAAGGLSSGRRPGRPQAASLSLGKDGRLNAVTIPRHVMRTLFPGAGARFKFGLRVFIDGAPYGGRFPTEAMTSRYNTAVRRESFRLMTELAGLRLLGWRAGAGPVALDLLLGSAEAPAAMAEGQAEAEADGEGEDSDERAGTEEEAGGEAAARDDWPCCRRRRRKGASCGCGRAEGEG